MSVDLSSTGSREGSPASGSPHDFDQWIADTPAHHTVKGMFIQSLIKAQERAGHKANSAVRYVGFKDYPLREFMRMMLDSSQVMFPKLSLGEALRMQGRLVFPTLPESMIGKVIFSVAGRDYPSALNLVTKAYEVSLSPGRAELVELGKKRAVVALHDVWNFAPYFQVGVQEGAMAYFNITGTVEAQMHTRARIDLILKWT